MVAGGDKAKPKICNIASTTGKRRKGGKTHRKRVYELERDARRPSLFVRRRMSDRWGGFRRSRRLPVTQNPTALMLEQNPEGTKENSPANNGSQEELLSVALGLCRSPVERRDVAVLPPAAAAT